MFRVSFAVYHIFCSFFFCIVQTSSTSTAIGFIFLKEPIRKCFFQISFLFCLFLQLHRNIFGERRSHREEVREREREREKDQGEKGRQRERVSWKRNNENSGQTITENLHLPLCNWLRFMSSKIVHGTSFLSFQFVRPFSESPTWKVNKKFAEASTCMRNSFDINLTVKFVYFCHSVCVCVCNETKIEQRLLFNIQITI